jgi:hypothetical protein
MYVKLLWTTNTWKVSRNGVVIGTFLDLHYVTDKIQDLFSATYTVLCFPLQRMETGSWGINLLLSTVCVGDE